MRSFTLTIVAALLCSYPASAQAPEGFSAVPCAAGEVSGMSCVAGGPFTRGTESFRLCKQGEVARIPKKKPNHRPISQVTLQTFYMDITEVTYGAYQGCVKAGKCKRSKPLYNDYDRENQPMVGMSWYDAHQFCEAIGKQLPTEAQWEKAARGADGELYPWGNEEPTCERAVLMDESGRSCGVQKKAPSGYKGRTLEVKSRPAGRYGLYDMIGNAEEWTADWYTKDWDRCGADCAGVDPRGPCGDQAADTRCGRNQKKVVRGGSWYWPKECATSWNRRPHFAKNKPYHHFGFRCAATVEQARQLQAQ
jgi:sulfatase modifying factor 1